MSRILITGSADGLGRMAARLLIEDGHEVVLHARNEQRAEEALASAPGAAAAFAGDLSSIDQTRLLAADANAYGRFDAVIHNAGVGYREHRIETEDGLEHVFAINVLAPYLLTALIDRPSRRKTKRQSFRGSPLHSSFGIVSNSQAKTLSVGQEKWIGVRCGGENDKKTQRSPCIAA